MRIWKISFWIELLQIAAISNLKNSPRRRGAGWVTCLHSSWTSPYDRLNCKYFLKSFHALLWRRALKMKIAQDSVLHWRWSNYLWWEFLTAFKQLKKMILLFNPKLLPKSFDSFPQHHWATFKRTKIPAKHAVNDSAKKQINELLNSLIDEA